MKFYIELTLMENKKITMYELWSKIYTQIHLAFVEQKNDVNQICFGVSLPEYRFNEKANIGFLGSKLRIFAKTDEELQVLDLSKWLSRLMDYVHIQSIKPVPDKVDGYAVYQRHQVKGNPQRLARRYAKRHDVSYEEALKIYQSMDLEMTNLPYVQMKSLSKNQMFKLFIEKTVVDSESTEARFTTYGLNAKDSFFTVPEF
ncbi:type I-F CRISPR-associated endoribonuclease Cas6/Csy4 [Wohlfahrtiimonas larvae]|uniref:Uncharacterized protein n=1 Tax=Wohlfahrtiimonas larvae TaxID=1157986 RepID=A0ABP9MJB4_9GAMM|nr:type I-F CRISPR-associated endoribonuclease Cas6/Csy4 [Wohlfahrtiimonas larvae]